MPRRLKGGRRSRAERVEPDSGEAPPAVPVQVFEKDGLSCFAVRVQPRSSRLGFAGMHGNALKIQLTAPAVQDRANRQLVEFLASCLGVPKSSVFLIAGSRARDKTIAVARVEGDRLRQMLERFLE